MRGDCDEDEDPDFEPEWEAMNDDADPFFIEAPAVISFSGGRTSAYMLRLVLDVHEGTLPSGVHVLFANTGKERPETLDFVRDVQTRWDVPIHWLEYDRGGEYGAQEWSFRVVTHATASRQGEPFERLISARGLPNPVFRFCTQELKIRPMRDWMRAQGYEHWTNVVGIRADEPSRVAKMRAPNRERWDVALPLAEARTTEADVMAMWLASRCGMPLDEWLALRPVARPGWDLALRPDEGNCDLCFLKGPIKRQRLMRERPDLSIWWLEQERRTGSTFRRDVPSYAELLQQGDLLAPLGEFTDCYCTD